MEGSNRRYKKRSREKKKPNQTQGITTVASQERHSQSTAQKDKQVLMHGDREKGPPCEADSVGRHT